MKTKYKNTAFKATEIVNVLDKVIRMHVCMYVCIYAHIILNSGIGKSLIKKMTFDRTFRSEKTAM